MSTLGMTPSENARRLKARSAPSAALHALARHLHLALWSCLALDFLSCTFISAAGFSSAAIGTTSGDFLELGVGARAVGMGEAYSAVADDASALYWNPAALTRIPSKSITVMHAAYIASSYFDYGAFGQNLGRLGAWGAGFQFLSAGSISETDQTATEIGNFAPNDLSASVGYAYELHDMDFMSDLNGTSFGVTGKYIQSTILTTAKTGAADIGMLTPAYWNDRFRFAATITNIGGKLKFEQGADFLPLAFRFGGSMKISNHWTGAVDIGLPKDNNPYAAVGTEYQFPVSAGVNLAGRLGYNSRTAAGIDGFSGVSLGFGLGLRNFGFDYAFVPMGGLGQTHRISLNFSF